MARHAHIAGDAARWLNLPRPLPVYNPTKKKKALAQVFFRLVSQMPTTDELRVWTYQALISECKNRWATLEEIWEHVPEEKKMPAVIDGLVSLRELEAEERDGVRVFRLTTFGESWASMMLLGKEDARKRPSSDDSKEEEKEEDGDESDVEYSF